MPEEINEYEQERRSKLQKLRDLGVDPYGQRTAGVSPLADIKALHKPEFAQDGGPVVTAAGRIMLKRDMGKLTFMTLRDETGDLQIALDKKRLSELDWKINDLLDLGDTVVVTGPLGMTKKLEPTIWATSLQIASKALLPPPTKEHKNEQGEVTKSGFSDIEQRYRQRYVDLWANPEVMKTLKLRMRIVDEIRQFMRSRGYMEVETPMMQTLAGGAAARPFETHHNALDIPLFLRIAPELYLKRLLVGGFSKVFELNRNFRNEGISPKHNPEFTMLEAYEAFGSWETMAELVESMICHVAQNVVGTLVLNHEDTKGTKKTIDLRGDETKPQGQRWRRASMSELVNEKCSLLFDSTHGFSTGDLSRLALLLADARWGEARNSLAAHVVRVQGESPALIPEIAKSISSMPGNLPNLVQDMETQLRSMSRAEQLVAAYEKLVEPTLLNPTFVTQVPSVIIPLAKKSAADPFFADVYELAINGQEISPGYTELNDPLVQEENFKHQVGEQAEQQKTDEDFLTALKYGMPPAGGLGLGIDRLVMMLTGAESIRDVILFPLMRPQE